MADPSTTLDLTSVLQPILETAATIAFGLIAAYVPKGLALLEARTGIHLTDQQRATILGAVQTGAGILETKIDQGVLTKAHITIDNPEVLAQARAAIAAVPTAAAALGMTEQGVARMIVGAADTAAHSGPAPMPVPASVPKLAPPITVVPLATPPAGAP